MKDKLEILENTKGHYIAWVCEGELGAVVGEFRNNILAEEDIEIRLVERIAAQEANAMYLPAEGKYIWASSNEAKKTLQKMKFALAQERPLPDWAVTALKEGWKPPRGWKA